MKNERLDWLADNPFKDNGKTTNTIEFWQKSLPILLEGTEITRTILHNANVDPLGKQSPALYNGPRAKLTPQAIDKIWEKIKNLSGKQADLDKAFALELLLIAKDATNFNIFFE